MKNRFECPGSPKDNFDIGIFGREYRLKGTSLRVGAGTTGELSERPRAMMSVELRGKDLGIRLAGDDKGADSRLKRSSKTQFPVRERRNSRSLPVAIGGQK